MLVAIAASASALTQQFEMHYTPKKGSWLNIAELELPALSRVCLSRRIRSIEELDHQIQAIVKERNEIKIKVEWQFSISQAREKLIRHYEKVKTKNLNYRALVHWKLNFLCFSAPGKIKFGAISSAIFTREKPQGT